MTKIPLTVVAAALLSASIAFAQTLSPPPQDRTAVETDKQEVARAIASLKPNEDQLKSLLKAHKAAHSALKAKEKAAIRELILNYAAQMQALLKSQAAEKQSMLDKMR